MRESAQDRSATLTNFPRERRLGIMFLPLSLVLILAFIGSIAFGSVSIPLASVLRVLSGFHIDTESWRVILLDFRVPKALTAVMAGAALGVGGLQMQTLFRNPLADPFILGISSGASLGVAIAVLAVGSVGTSLLLPNMGFLQGLGVTLAASVGASVAFAFVVLVSQKVRHLVTLLVLGLMLGYTTGAIVSILVYFSIPERVQTFLNWTFGSFGGVTWNQMRILAPVVILGLMISQACAKPLNGLLLGEDYARSMGLDVRHARMWVMGSTSLLAGAITAFCGPIVFLGVAVPHLARSLFNTADHIVLLPAVMMLGGSMALILDLVAQMPGGSFTLPLNAVTSLVGAPIVIWVVLRNRNFRSDLAT